MKTFRIFCPHCNRAAFTLEPKESARLLDDPMMISDGRHRSETIDDTPEKVGGRQVPKSEHDAMSWWVLTTTRNEQRPGLITCIETGQPFELRVDSIRGAWRDYRKGGKVAKIIGEPTTWLSNPSRDW